MNDIELTKKRQEYIEKYGLQKGFPIHVVLTLDEDIKSKVFFTRDAAFEYIDSLECEYIYELAHADDVREVSYKI